MQIGIVIDNVSYDVVAGIKRTANITPSQISGMLLDKTYFNDVIGTYLQYEVQLAIPHESEPEYAALYEVLTDPVADHRVILPYNNTAVEIVGRIETISDSYVETVHKNNDVVNLWRNITFVITANHPTKEYTLNEVIERGVSPLPDVSELDEGKVYMVVNGQWVMTSLTRADENYY